MQEFHVRTKEELMEEFSIYGDPWSVCDCFSNEVVSPNGTKISAKEFRMWFRGLSSFYKPIALELLYDPSVREKNMKRVPPSKLAAEVKGSNIDRELAIAFAKNHMIYIYNSLKCQSRFERFRRMLYEYQKKPLFSDDDLAWSVGTFGVNRSALLEIIEELRKDSDEVPISPMNLPEDITIGVEIECVGATLNQFLGLYNELKDMYEIDYLDGFNMETDASVYERVGKERVKRMGFEIQTPILGDDEESWKRLKDACAFLNLLGMRGNHTCGGHIHIGSEVLGYDKQAWINFRDICREAQPLLYIICNRRGELPREGVNYFAKPVKWSNNVSNISDVTINNLIDLREFIASYVVNYGVYSIGSKYQAINFKHLTFLDTNTIERRDGNATTKYEILRENILLFARIMQIAKKRATFPDWKKDEWDNFFEEGLPEREKLERFLNLVFDEEDEKKIYRDRWICAAGNDIGVNDLEYSYERCSGPIIRTKPKEKDGKKTQGHDEI